jgi:hypothetical protein
LERFRGKQVAEILNTALASNVTQINSKNGAAARQLALINLKCLSALI